MAFRSIDIANHSGDADCRHTTIIINKSHKSLAVITSQAAILALRIAER